VNQSSLTLFTLSLFIPLFCTSCATVEAPINFDIEYPESWSERAHVADCSNISGQFGASGAAIEKARNPLFSHSEKSLEIILFRGPFGGEVNSFDLDYVNDTGVLNLNYYGRRLQSAEQYGKVPPQYRNTLFFQVQGTCADGQFVLDHKRPWGGSGESGTTKAEGISYLSIAKDGSLIIKHISQIWVSKWFGLSIEKSESVGWYKFKKQFGKNNL